MTAIGRRNILVATALGAGLALLTTAGWAALAPLPPLPRERVYVIPKGTGARQAAGQRVSPLPSRIRLLLGIQDVLVLRNEDEAPQSFGPIELRPGQTYRVPFQVAATFDFACSVHEDGQVAIVVERAPARGWPRIRWRAAEALGR
jgi:hypothetical protein